MGPAEGPRAAALLRDLAEWLAASPAWTSPRGKRRAHTSPARMAEFLWRRYCAPEPCTLEQLAREYGISAHAAGRILARGRALLYGSPMRERGRHLRGSRLWLAVYGHEGTPRRGHPR